MSANVSNVSICNQALSKVGAAPISALTDTTPNAIACNTHFWPVRNALYRAHVWSFATRRASIATSIPSPIFGYANAFPIPSDFIRLLPPDVTSDVNVNVITGNALTFGIAQGSVDRILENVPTGPADPISGIVPTATAILTNETAPIQVRYVAKIEDPNQMDPLFRIAFATALAIELCEPLTQSNTKKAALEQKFAQLIMEARRAEGIEAPPQKGVTDDWILSRL